MKAKVGDIRLLKEIPVGSRVSMYCIGLMGWDTMDCTIIEKSLMFVKIKYLDGAVLNMCEDVQAIIRKLPEPKNEKPKSQNANLDPSGMFIMRRGGW